MVLIFSINSIYCFSCEVVFFVTTFYVDDNIPSEMWFLP
jgi:hypothetical protein